MAEGLMYEINWHYVEDKFSHITVTPINILKRVILPGCTAETISFLDSRGVECISSPNYYHETEEAAWAEAKKGLEDSLAGTLDLASLNLAQAKRLNDYLKSL